MASVQVQALIICYCHAGARISASTSSSTQWTSPLRGKRCIFQDLKTSRSSVVAAKYKLYERVINKGKQLVAGRARAPSYRELPCSIPRGGGSGIRHNSCLECNRVCICPRIIY